MDFNLIWLVIFLPLMGSIIQALTGKAFVNALGPKKGKALMGFLAIAFIGLAFAIAFPITAELYKMPETGRSAVVNVFDWITLQSISIPFELRIDPLSMTMALIVTGIGCLIHVYAVGYMFEDRDFTRFFTYLNLFIAFMLVLVLGNNLPLLFIGWEGVGVCSYLLIGFWYKDLKNSKAANKAFIVNRVGDFFLTLGMFWIVLLVAQHKDAAGIVDPRWLSYDVLMPHALEIFRSHPNETFWIAILLFGGAAGKSAQFPLYVWLPDAMAGPTPVSALIHAATMVTSGVVLLNRMSPIVSMSPLAMSIIALVGALTALFGASIAFGQTDIKKVLAYSTVSQLGFMFIACGVGAFWAGMFHVITHAFFKALLFLGSGSVIYAMAHNQDMRNYGRLSKWIKITFGLMMVGFLAIAGVPYAFSGFWSKEAILGNAVNDHVTLQIFPGMTAGALAGWIGFGVALMTAFYMTRMMMLTFFSGPERWLAIEPGHHHDDHHHGHHDHHDEHHHHGPDEHGFFYADNEVPAEEHEHHHDLDKTHKPKEVPFLMNAPLIILAVFSLGIFGWKMEDGHFLQNWLKPQMTVSASTHNEGHGIELHGEEAGHGGEAAHAEESHGEGEHGEEGAHHVPHLLLVGLSFAIVILGIGAGIAVYGKKLPEKEGWDESKWSKVRLWARNQWGYDWLVTDGSIKVGGALGKLIRIIDERLVDGTVDLVGKASAALGSVFRKPQTGLVRGYALMMEMGVAAIFFYLIYTLMNMNGGMR